MKKGVSYSDKKGDTHTVFVNQEIPKEAISEGLFTQECLDRLVRVGRLRVEKDGSSISSKELEEGKEQLKNLSKEDLVRHAKSLGLDKVKDLATLSVKQLVELIENSGRQNKIEANTQVKGV